MNLDILCITHADFEGPEIIESWAKEQKHNFEIIKPYKGELLPKPDDFDLLIIMGGPQSPRDIEGFSYLKKLSYR